MEYRQAVTSRLLALLKMRSGIFEFEEGSDGSLKGQDKYDAREVRIDR